MTLAQPDKKFAYRSIGCRSSGHEFHNEENDAIPHLKSLLEKLSSPVKRRKEHARSQAIKMAANSINSSRARLRVHFRNG